jgi:hypothetical protein
MRLEKIGAGFGLLLLGIVMLALRMNGDQTPTSPCVHTVERFVPIDAFTLRYELTIDDPGTWTQSWIVRSNADVPPVRYAVSAIARGRARRLHRAKADRNIVRQVDGVARGVASYEVERLHDQGTAESDAAETKRVSPDTL